MRKKLNGYSVNHTTMLLVNYIVYVYHQDMKLQFILEKVRVRDDFFYLKKKLNRRSNKKSYLSFFQKG